MSAFLTRVVLVLGGSIEASIVTKATIVVALALLGARLARGTRASVRHLLLATAFGMLMVLPALVLVVPPVAVRIHTEAEARLTRSTPPESHGAFAIDDLARIVRVSEANVVTEGARVPMAASTLVRAGWATGLVCVLMPLALGVWRVRRVRRSGLGWAAGDSIVRSLSMRSGVRRSVTVLLHEDVVAPLTCGIFRPVIVLPAGVDAWNEADLEHAIVHELEHIHRADWPIHLVARVACAVYWFHPLVWMAWRQLSLESERACDARYCAAPIGRPTPTNS